MATADNTQVVGGNPGGENQPGAVVDTSTQQPQNPPGGGQTPVAGADKPYSFKEDRSDWVPRQRLNESTEKYDKRIKALEAQLGDQQSQQERIKKAFGVETPSTEEAEAEAVREQLYKILPGLKNLDRFSPEQLDKILAAADTAQAAGGAHWKRHANSMFESLSTETASRIGAGELTPRQFEKIKEAYIAEARLAYEARKAADEAGDTSYDADNDFLGRHERGDKTLVKDFVKEFLGDWYEPARRSAVATQNRRQRPVPSGDRTRTTAVTKVPEVDFNNDDAFKKAMLEARNGG